METNADSPPPHDTAASSIRNLFLNEINKQDVGGLLLVQTSLYVQSDVRLPTETFPISARLEQLDKSNEVLEGINKVSAKRYLDATKEYANHAQMLTNMKSDLDAIFKRIKYVTVPSPTRQ